MATKIDHLKWVQKAVAKDKHRAAAYPTLVAPRIVNGATLGADGFRLHRVECILAQDPTDLDEPPPFDNIIAAARDLPIALAVTRDDLVQTLKVAMSVQPLNNRVRLSANGALSIRAISPDNGDAGGTITADEKTLISWGTKKMGERWRKAIYLHAGADASMNVNGKLLLDALSGMPENVGILFRPEAGEQAAMMRVAGVMEDGVVREAIIMGLLGDSPAVHQENQEQGVENGTY